MNRRAIFLFAILAAATPGVAAASLAVWPLFHYLSDDGRSSVIHLKNNDDHDVLYQVDVYEWTQGEGCESDCYEIASGVVASPPFARVPAGRVQQVRVVLDKTSPPDSAVRAYRVFLRPVPLPGAGDGPVNVDVRVAMAVPVFVAPVIDGLDAAAYQKGELQQRYIDHLGIAWHQESGIWYLKISNQSPIEYRLSEVEVRIGKGDWEVFNNSLLGYVLPGATRNFPVPAALEKSDFCKEGQIRFRHHKAQISSPVWTFSDAWCKSE